MTSTPPPPGSTDPPSPPPGLGPSRVPKHGPIFDTALRRMIESEPIHACHLLGIPVTTAPRVISAAMPSGTLSADLILQVGPRDLAHVEYMRDVTADLVARMLIYRGLIMREHPDQRLVQHIIVLGRGSVRGYDDLPGRGFALDLTLHYLREIPPAELLADPGLAPLAALGCGSAIDRAEAFGAALRLIHERGGARTRELIEFATVLATIRLDRNTINKIAKEISMTVESIATEFEPTEFGQELLARGRARGRQEARIEVLTALLRDRFGDRPELAATAARLAGWIDTATAIRTVTSAQTWADVAGLEQSPAE